MRIDIVIGNPPYQTNYEGENGSCLSSLYEVFILNSFEYKPRFVTMITKSTWFNGAYYKEFREKFLKTNNIKKIVDYMNPEEVFIGMDGISGGVSYFLWDKNFNNRCLLECHSEGNTQQTLLNSNIDIIIRYPMLNSIIEKVVNSADFESMKNQVSGQKPFGFKTNDIDSNKAFDTKTSEHSIMLLGSYNRIKYVGIEDITKGLDIIDRYKVIINQCMCERGLVSDSSNKFKVISVMKLLNPNEVCTQTYLVVGSSDNAEICKNIYKYIRTKFVRALMLSTLGSKSISFETFQFVPTQDFSLSWTDEMLYNKYGLTTEESSYIENLIKPME